MSHPQHILDAITLIADYAAACKADVIESRTEAHQLRAWVEVQCQVAIEDPDWESLHEINVDDVAMTEDEIIAYALAHAAATLDMSGDEDALCMNLLYEYGGKIGVDVPEGDEYQRAVLHRFDPDRVPDFPLGRSE
jgi:hypothetical protein